MAEKIPRIRYDPERISVIIKNIFAKVDPITF
jgi:hypothetical protein